MRLQESIHWVLWLKGGICQEIVQTTVQLIRTRLDGDIDLAGTKTVLGGVQAVLQLELLDRVGRRDVSGTAKKEIRIGYPIDDVADRGGTCPIYTDRGELSVQPVGIEESRLDAPGCLSDTRTGRQQVRKVTSADR